MVHKELDSSKVLFKSNGDVKLGIYPPSSFQSQIINYQVYFDECYTTAKGLSKPLGAIALEMMQSNKPSEEDTKFHLKHPARWSGELKNFMHISFHGTLEDVENVSNLYF